MTYFGVHAGPQMCTMNELRELWKEIEALDYDWISTWDHFYANPVAHEQDCFEGVASHSALAALTSRVRVGSLVYSAGYRHPAVFANSMVTIDHISDGRAEVGIGAGWHKPEYDGYGIEFEAPGVRLRRLAEYLEVVRLLWTEELASFDGEFYTLREARCNPKPIQRIPRIWVGAAQPKALQVAGRFGECWNTSAVTPAQFAERYDIVRGAAEHPDRIQTGLNLQYVASGTDGLETALRKRLYDPDQPVLMESLLVGDNMNEAAERIQQYVDVGVQWIILTPRAPFDHDAIARFATEVIPQFRT